MRTQTRGGFTLVELMVAMALTLFIMVILSQAFVLSLETFAGMKGLGDMQINLRTATNILRDDLSQDHFEGKRRLSDVDALGRPLIVLQPPQAGFLAVLQRTAPSAAGPGYIFEGNDTNGLPSDRANNHILYMTVKRRGNRQENFFTTSLTGAPADLATFFTQATAYDVPPPALADQTLTLPYNGVSGTGFYSSQWAEVAYYLVGVGSTEEPNNPNGLGTPTFGLYRCQFVMVPDGTNLTAKFATPAYPVPQLTNLAQNTFASVSCNPTLIAGQTHLAFHSPADAAIGNRAFPNLAAFNPASPRVTMISTLVLPSVISFQVQIMMDDASMVRLGLPKGTFVDVPATGAPAGHLYDTALFTAPAATYNNKAGLKAIQITLRVWDNKTRQTRQVTVVQDL